MNILESILQKKRQRLAAGIALAPPAPARHFPRELLRRFQSAVPRVIAEMKKASPSAGLIRAQYDPVSLARQYQAAGAFAISVLTEQDFFQGSLEHLRAVRQAVDLPLLRKDFIIAPEQLRESRSHGADMALLIVACLEQELLRDLVAAAEQEQLLPLVEVHDEEEADRAMEAGARLLGINNRNLKSFQVDLQAGARVATYVRGRYGDEIVLVAESGIHSASDMRVLAAAGCQAFLIGESLLRAPHPGRALAALLAEIADRKLQVASRKSKVASRKEIRAATVRERTTRSSQIADQGPERKELWENESQQPHRAPEASGEAPSATSDLPSAICDLRSAISDPQPAVPPSQSTMVDPQSAICDLRFAISDLPSTPDSDGHYGCYGGKFVPETLMAPLQELEAAFVRYCGDSAFRDELDSLLREYVGRPTPLTFAARLSQELAARIYFKREDLCHTGAHKINNALGQALLARRMGKRRIVAETGAGQHGVAVATVCALLGLQCCVYMGVEDMARQELNVFRMKLLGADVVPVHSGSRTLKDAINETMRDWVTNVEETHYLLGSVLGPHPYPRMVRDFQSVIGREARAQILEKEARLPDVLIACVGGGSNSLGLFYPFLGDDAVAMVGVEAGGRGSALGEHAARFQGGSPGVLHGCYTYLLQDADGQIAPTHSISAGLDYAAVGPEHALLHDAGRIRFAVASDDETVRACRFLAETEGLIPALESAHAVAELLENRAAYRGRLIIVNLSGRGDKDMPALRREIETATPARPGGDAGGDPR